MGYITDESIELKVKQDSVMGFQKGQSSKPEKPGLNTKPDKDDKRSEISGDEMLVMEQYAKLLPRGNRKLKLNVPLLRDTVLAKDLIAAPLTKTSGLNSGGNNSLKTKGPAKSQKDYIVNIQNKNSLKTNPNFTSFKNNFSL